MKKIAFIIPWFGKFRNDFYFWMKSAEYNPTVDFLFFTDQEITAPPNNLKVIKTTLGQIENLAKQKIWKGCILSKAYKLSIISLHTENYSPITLKAMTFGDIVMWISFLAIFVSLLQKKY